MIKQKEYYPLLSNSYDITETYWQIRNIDVDNIYGNSLYFEKGNVFSDDKSFSLGEYRVFPGNSVEFTIGNDKVIGVIIGYYIVGHIINDYSKIRIIACCYSGEDSKEYNYFQDLKAIDNCDQDDNKLIYDIFFLIHKHNISCRIENRISDFRIKEFADKLFLDKKKQTLEKLKKDIIEFNYSENILSAILEDVISATKDYNIKFDLERAIFNSPYALNNFEFQGEFYFTRAIINLKSGDFKSAFKLFVMGFSKASCDCRLGNQIKEQNTYILDSFNRYDLNCTLNEITFIKSIYLFALDKHIESLETINLYLTENKNDEIGYYIKARNLFILDKKEEAIKILQNNLKINETARDYYRLARFQESTPTYFGMSNWLKSILINPSSSCSWKHFVIASKKRNIQLKTNSNNYIVKLFNQYNYMLIPMWFKKNIEKADVKLTLLEFKKSLIIDKILFENPEEVNSLNISNEILFVKYEVKAIIDGLYPINKLPEKGCVIRSHSLGRNKRRGYKEDAFQLELENYFAKDFLISGNIILNTGKNTRPYEPDIALIDLKSGKNLRIEIDEPYSGYSRKAIHLKHDDDNRDQYFTDRGWVVIRFSEYQVHTQAKSCLLFVANLVQLINKDFIISNELIKANPLNNEEQWSLIKAQQWERNNYRENYLDHTFNERIEQKETYENSFNEKEEEEEKLVMKKENFGEVEIENYVKFNNLNKDQRDSRISFYQEQHIYTVDNIEVNSATSIISKFFIAFDSFNAANNLSMNHELYGLPITEIISIWKEKGDIAANEGSFLHSQIENYFLGKEYIKPKEWSLFKQFLVDHPNLSPFRTEWRIFDETYSIAGTIDLIVENNEGYELYDWKRSKKIVDLNNNIIIEQDNYGKMGIGILSHINDTSYQRYCIQQSLYKYIIEKNYGIKISKMYLVVIHPLYNQYHKIKLPYMKNEIEMILDNI